MSAPLRSGPALGKATWSQSTDEVFIQVPVASSTKGRDVKLEVHPKRLQLRVEGATVLEGSLVDCGEIVVDDCFWTMESGSDDSPQRVLITLCKKEMGYQSWTTLLEEDVPDMAITHRVYMQLEAGGKALGRVAIGLYGNAAPRTVENFVALCKGDGGVGGMGKALSFSGCNFHRIIPGFMVQGGDITNGDGTGGDSIFGPTFEDENLKLKHDGAGVLAMANAGKDTNSSQFYITLAAQPHLDGKHVVFGKVEAGMELVRRLESMGSSDGTPKQAVRVVSCGELDTSEEVLMDIVATNKLLHL
ncbi:MAG: hypothetical protein WDW36_004437 [Sanguina aurantia]